eukprot:scaffold5337_cov167-Amphora_coffeaeformis.AAC.15
MAPSSARFLSILSSVSIARCLSSFMDKSSREYHDFGSGKVGTMSGGTCHSGAFTWFRII